MTNLVFARGLRVFHNPFSKVLVTISPCLILFFEPQWECEDWANPWNVRAKEFGASSARHVVTVKFVERNKATRSLIRISHALEGSPTGKREEIDTIP